MNPPDYSDVQGLALYGYGKLVEARYWLLRVKDAAAARAWLAAAPITTAEPRATAPDNALQVAFTASGLRALGVDPTIVEGFSEEFLSGMADENRSRRLGDVAASHPSCWRWGAPDCSPDVLVMLFSQANLDSWTRTVQAAPWAAAFETIQTLETSNMHDHEPFGFADGISQPQFDWERQRDTPGTTTAYENPVALGELLLGYPNEYGHYTDRPLLDPAADPRGDLLPAEDSPGQRDLGRNGTYLVLRELEQDVRGFWQYLDRATANSAGRYRLGAQMVGRTLDGDPLIPSQSQNEFTYDQDAAGVACPFGAHIRRANPRNADLFGHPPAILGLLNRLAIPRPKLHDDLMASTRFHRILRRGREYGEEITPEQALEIAPPGEKPRGLQFACLCANLLRQFEFVQSAWLMSSKFDGLTEESDPLLGNRAAAGGCPAASYFSIPRDGKPARRLADLPQFVTVRGGAYFFMPSLRARNYIAHIGAK